MPSCSSTRPVRRTSRAIRDTRSRRCRSDRVARAGGAARAPGEGRGDRAEHRGARRRRGAREAIDRVADETGLPADDPVRFGAGRLLDRAHRGVSTATIGDSASMKRLAVLRRIAKPLRRRGGGAAPRLRGDLDRGRGRRRQVADDGGAWFVSQMKEVGLQENRITIGWNPEEPTTIPEQESSAATSRRRRRTASA